MKEVKGKMRGSFALDSKFVGALPIVNHVLSRLKFSELLGRHLPPPDARSKMPAAKALDVVVRNLILARTPLYAVGEWARHLVPGLLGLNVEALERIDDDRLGRALDRLFDADRNALLTELVLDMIRTFRIELEEFHNDSTSLTLQGEYAEATGKPVRGKKTVLATPGYNRDHRPDLKQLLWILTVSADGSVPVLFKVADGNTEDSTTHLETWTMLRRLVGGPNFIYVADSKLCTRDNMRFIDSQSGSFITVLPRTRSEDRLFKDWLQTHPPAWAEINRQVQGAEDRLGAMESPIPAADGFRLIWYHSSLKHDHDAQSRQKCIQRAWRELEAFAEILEGPRCRYTTTAGVAKAAERILAAAHAARWLEYEIEPWEERTYRQEKRGRPDSKTRWRRRTKSRFRLRWKPNLTTMDYDGRTDGIFPLVTNRKDLSVFEVQEIYRSKQPMIEKRHDLLKNVLGSIPAFLKSISRLEALLFLFYVGLTVHALIEREVRRTMKSRRIASLPLYPEDRECKAPTASRIFETFSNLQRHYLMKDGQVAQRFLPELSPLQKDILSLLHIPPRWFLEAAQS
jgi:transposase